MKSNNQVSFLDDILVTVILPAYNAEEYVERSIDSVLTQTYSNIQLIVVDDGSTDGTGGVIDRCAKRDRRIIAVHTQNAGVSAARNNGIDRAKGEFITFLDADDYLDPNYIKDLCDALSASGAKVATCSVNRVNKYTPTLIKNNNINKIRTIAGPSAASELLYQRSVENGVIAKMYSKDLFKEVRFNNYVAYAEDLEINFAIIKDLDIIAAISMRNYYYLQRDNSAIHMKFSPKRMDGLYVTSQILKDSLNANSDFIKSAENRHFMEAFYILLCIQMSGTNTSVYYNKCTKVIKEFRKNVLFDRKSRLRYRIIALLSFIGYSLPINLFTYKNKLLRPVL